MNDPLRILIVRLSHLGDVACSLALLHALHTAYPRARIAWAIQPEFAGLLEGLPGLERTILFERRGGPAAWWRVRRALSDFAPQLTVDAQGNLKSAAITWLSGAPRRVGMARAQWREWPGHWVLNDPAPELPPERARHLVERVDGLIAHLLPGSSPWVERSPAASPAELARGERLLQPLRGATQAPLVVSLSTPGDPRGWSQDRWSEFLASMEDKGRAVLIIHGPAEHARAQALKELHPDREHLRHWAQPMDLRTLVGLLSACTQRGSRFLGVDSGPMHLAWTSGLPVTVLEGPCDAARTGPWPVERAGHRTLLAEPSPSCAPCFKRRCTHPEGNVCMQRILPDRVLEALD